MIRRAWLLVSALWFAVMIGNNLTRTVPMVGLDDLTIATLPLWGGAALWYGLRFVLFGR